MSKIENVHDILDRKLKEAEEAGGYIVALKLYSGGDAVDLLAHYSQAQLMALHEAGLLPVAKGPEGAVSTPVMGSAIDIELYMSLQLDLRVLRAAADGVLPIEGLFTLAVLYELRERMLAKIVEAATDEAATMLRRSVNAAWKAIEARCRAKKMRASPREQAGLPGTRELDWLVLEELRGLPMPATNRQMEEAVASRLNLTAKQQSVRSGNGQQTEVANRVAWTRTRLKNAGALEWVGRGEWRLTAEGRSLHRSTLESRL